MRLLVLGGAVSGSAAARLAAGRGHEVVVHDRDPEALARLGTGPWQTVGGRWRAELLDGVEVVVSSPGIPEGAPPLRDAMARGLPVWSEMEFAARHLRVPYVAVTGTNGKTTTTLAVTEMLRASGVDAVAAGNVGLALSSVVDGGHEIVVVEASSFQLRFIDRFRPAAACILNVAEDHLDWHRDSVAYRAAKARIFENMDAGSTLAYDADDPGAAALVGGAAVRAEPLSATRVPAGGHGRDGDSLVVDGEGYPLPAVSDVFVVDVLAAAVLALRAGAVAEGVAEVLRDFSPPDHRRQVVGTWDGVTWIDDSKATNPHAAVAAASAYPSVVLIAGGLSKGLDLGPLGSIETVKRLVAIGAAAEELAAATPPDRFRRADSLEEAVRVADEAAAEGDVVLLAPGCASFDMFSSYAERGDRFGAAVRELKAAAMADRDQGEVD